MNDNSTPANDRVVPVPTHPGPSKMDRPASIAALSVAALMWARIPERLGLSPEQTLEIVEYAVAGAATLFAFVADWRARRDRRSHGQVLALLLLLCFVGCGTIPIHAPTATPDDRTLLELAADDIGLGVEYVDSPIGAVHVDLVDDSGAKGWDGKVWPLVCSPQTTSERDTVVLRHELGHTLTLDHSDSETNVMYPSVGSDTDQLTLRQRRRMRAALVYLRACREAQR